MAKNGMNKDIIDFKIDNELDIVLAYKRAMQLSEWCGLALSHRTKFATAVSEICRNVLEHVGHGHIKYSIVEIKGKLFLDSLVWDRGRGIPQLEEILSKKSKPSGAKGWGIYNSQKLVEHFSIQSEFEKGTSVNLRKQIPHNHPVFTNAVIQGWIEHFQFDEEISPYAEIKNQNMQLIELLEQLRQKNIETENQLEVIRRLNKELQASNEEVSGFLEERERNNAKLVSINRELDTFAQSVSHDLKAPLFNIFSLANIIEECVEENNMTEIKQTIKMLQGQAVRMEKFISDVLLYATTGRQEIPKTEIDLNSLLSKILTSLSIPAHLNVTVQPQLPKLFSEEIYLEQIFSNLLGNALKYHDKPTGFIKVGCVQNNNFLQFSVADDGPGIPFTDQENIFRAYQTGSLHMNTSTGLGLSIIDKIIQRKRTAIWVESKGSGGTIFKFTWPADEVIE